MKTANIAMPNKLHGNMRELFLMKEYVLSFVLTQLLMYSSINLAEHKNNRHINTQFNPNSHQGLQYLVVIVE